MMFDENHFLQLFNKAEKFFFEGISQAHFHFEDAISVYVSGVKTANLNPVMQWDFCEKVPSILEECEKIYRKHQMPWVFYARGYVCDADLIQLLNHHGFEEVETTTVMYCDVLEVTPAQSRQLSIQEDDTLDAWKIPLHAFNTSDLIIAQYQKAHLRNPRRDAFQHWVGFFENSPVCCLTLSVEGNVARIDDVGTLPAYQGRGFATEMLRHALQQARALGAQHCFLEASSSGLRVYQNIGFKILCHNKGFERYTLRL